MVFSINGTKSCSGCPVCQVSALRMFRILACSVAVILCWIDLSTLHNFPQAVCTTKWTRDYSWRRGLWCPAHGLQFSYQLQELLTPDHLPSSLDSTGGRGMDQTQEGSDCGSRPLCQPIKAFQSHKASVFSLAFPSALSSRWVGISPLVSKASALLFVVCFLLETYLSNGFIWLKEWEVDRGY